MKRNKTICAALLACSLAVGLTQTASADRRPKKKEGQPSISVLDSTEAQWGQRSINDSLYRGYTVNAVYFERGRQKLPDSFNMYKPQPIGEQNLVRPVQSNGAPTTIRINGTERDLPTDKTESQE